MKALQTVLGALSVSACLVGGAMTAPASHAAAPVTQADLSTLRDHFYPGTEELGPDEMRITALGTGMPLLRPSQASACFLVELGNGEKFLFDLGTGSATKLAALGIPYTKLNKVFAGHLHSDHIGDLDALWMGGWVAGRTVPLEIWGPSGAEPRFGTAEFVEHFKKAYVWDYYSRVGRLPARGGELIGHEFDYSKPNVVYEKDGVTVTAFPAIHIFDGPVSFRLDWNGLSFVFSSDTNPNSFFIEEAKGADLVVHETFMTVDTLVDRWGWDRQTAINVGTWVHTSPAQAGRVFSEVKPRMAVGYHFFNDFDTRGQVEQEIRSTYDGPLSLAQDLMVWNITKDDMRVRMAVIPEDAWPARDPDTIGDYKTLPRGESPPFSDWLEKARVTFGGILGEPPAGGSGSDTTGE